MIKERPPLKLSLDQERILKLLTGTRFYSDRSAALREAILNAIDAIQRRQDETADLEPIIGVVFDRDESTLTVSDNGTGMNWQTVEELFAKIGASAATEEANKQSVGEFGIGIASYFMVVDRFELHTFDGVDAPIGLTFDTDMLVGGATKQLESIQSSRGTTVRLHIRDSALFDLLVERFPHWCRDIQGLSARLLPDGGHLQQGGACRQSGFHPVELPKWVERVFLGPVTQPAGWKAMTGNSTVSILYRGVFVQDFEAHSLWGIEGSIDVDPKHFKPRLNREGFVEGPFQDSVQAFLEDCHPGILTAMAKQLRTAFDQGALSTWTERRWANLWLSVPRTDPYRDTIAQWNSLFRTIPAFEIALGEKWQSTSFEQVIDKGRTIYLTPASGEGTNDAIKAATRFLRNTGKVVIRGIRREKSWMPEVTWSIPTTGDLIAREFASELHNLVLLRQDAQTLLTQIERKAPLFTGPPPIDLIELGQNSPPVLRLSQRLIINVDHPAGIAMVEDALRQNRGPVALIESAALHAHQQLPQVAAAIRGITQSEILGPVRRRYIRSLFS